MFDFNFFKNQVSVKEIPLELILPGKYQFRNNNNLYENDFKNFLDNIKNYGILEPILVKRLKNNMFEIVSGYRRFLGAKEAKLERLPAILINETEKKLIIMALSENIHRKNLSYFEETEIIFKLISEFNFTQEMIVNSLNVTHSFVSDRLKLLKLSHKAKNKIISQKLSLDISVLISSVENEADQLAIIDEIKKSAIDAEKVKNIIARYYDDKFKNDEKKRGQTIYFIKDLRFFDNSIIDFVKTMSASGVNSIFLKNETDDFIEYSIKIPKNRVYFKKSGAKSLLAKLNF